MKAITRLRKKKPLTDDDQHMPLQQNKRPMHSDMSSQHIRSAVQHIVHSPRRYPPTPHPRAMPRLQSSHRNKENASANPPALHDPPPAKNAPQPNSAANDIAYLKRVLKSVADLAAQDGRRLAVIQDGGKGLVHAFQSALQHNHPSLLRLSALVIARLTVDPQPAAALAHADYLLVLQGALEFDINQLSSGHDLLSIHECWRLSARAVRNMAAFSQENALVIARHSDLIRLLIVTLHSGIGKGHVEIVECTAALANFSRHGLQFQAYIKKHGGLEALSEAAQQAEDQACRFHACRALAEFSLDHKWLMLLIADGCIAIMLRIIETSKDDEIVSEATRFLGNIATSKIGREAINSSNGVDRIVERIITMEQDTEHTDKSINLAIDLLRTTSNLCVNSKGAAQHLINRGGVMAFIEAYGDDENAPQQLKTEAFRGLLIIAQGGPGFRASVLREIGIKIRQDATLGKCTAHLYDLGRRVKVEASAERKDDFPQTIAGLGERSKEYLFQAGPLASAQQDIPNSVPDMESPNVAAFRPSGRLLSVPRPVPHRERLERERKERSHNSSGSTFGHTPLYLPEMQRRPRTERSMAQESRARPDSAPSHHDSSNGHFAQREHATSEPYRMDNIPKAKIIESSDGKGRSDGNWVLAVWSAVCNAVTRPPNGGLFHGTERSGTGHDRTGSDADEGGDEGEDVYEMGVPLGRGGFATVFLAKNQRNGELVAVKRFHPLNTSTAEARKKAELAARRAIKEQRIWDGLSHKNIVSYRGCFFGENGELNLVAEYIPGWSLADHLSQISKFPEHMVACITQQIVDGLDYLHKCGVTHRDVKPANILVNPDGVIKITDFGVSSAVDVPTMTGNSLVGTPWYIAPEMIEGRPYGKSVDIWSLGCTVLELATGRRPYHNLRPHVALFRMTQDRMPAIPKKLSPVLRDFLKTCWVWDPAERPSPANLRRHPFLASVVKAEVTNLKNMTRKT